MRFSFIVVRLNKRPRRSCSGVTTAGDTFIFIRLSFRSFSSLNNTFLSRGSIARDGRLPRSFDAQPVENDSCTEMRRYPWEIDDSILPRYSWLDCYPVLTFEFIIPNQLKHIHVTIF